MGSFTTLVRCTIALGVLCALAITPAVGAAQAPTLTPLAERINGDGTLNSAGFSGSLDATGWTMTSAATGATLCARQHASGCGRRAMGRPLRPSRRLRHDRDYRGCRQRRYLCGWQLRGGGRLRS